MREHAAMLALRRNAAALALVPLAYLVLLHGLGRYGPVNGDEAFYHAVALTMVETGDYLRLDFFGEHRLYDTFMNAPLHYWLRAFWISLLGDGLVAMRIQSALFGVASVAFTAVLANRLAGARAAWLSAAVQLTTFQFVYWHAARTGELDTATAFFFTAVAASFVRFVETGRGIVVHHVCWMLLANWKLPLGLVPLVAEAAAFALLPPARRRFGRWLRTAIVVLPLGFVWHAGQLIAHWDGFVAVLERMLEQASQPPPGAREHGIGTNLRFYAFAVLYGAFPYSLLYPFAFASMLWGREAGGRIRWIVLGLFVVAVFAFFAVVQKHLRWYWLPALPLLSVFVGAWLDRAGREAARRPAPTAVAALAVLVAGLAVVDVRPWDVNPFAGRTASLPLVTPLRPLLGLAPLVAAGLLAIFVAAATVVARRRSGRRRPPVAVAIAVLALGFGGLRVLMPLQHLDHRTEMARVRDEIDALRAQGREPKLPLALREGGELKVRALFARDFEIVPGRAPVSWWLMAPGDPRAVDSIRHGLPDDAPR